MATLRSNPGQWTLVLEDAPVSVAVAVDRRAMTALRMTDGHVAVRRRNTRTDEQGKRHADLWMCFVPNEEK